MGQMIQVPRPDGSSTPAYLAQAPSSTTSNTASAPAIVLVQEWWGLNAHIREVADRLAAEGYLVLSPDLYRGRSTTDADEAARLSGGLDVMDATLQDIAGCVAWLAQGGRQVGVTGFCLGGALTVAAAVHVPGVSAAVTFYGIPAATVANPAHIRIPLQGHFAMADTWCTPSAVATLQQAMQGAGQSPEVFQYPAQHAFFNHSRPEVYDAECATQAWARMTDFWRRHLSA